MSDAERAIWLRELDEAEATLIVDAQRVDELEARYRYLEKRRDILKEYAEKLVALEEGEPSEAS